MKQTPNATKGQKITAGIMSGLVLLCCAGAIAIGGDEEASPAPARTVTSAPPVGLLDVPATPTTDPAVEASASAASSRSAAAQRSREAAEEREEQERLEAEERVREEEREEQEAKPEPESVYYENCAAVRAAGAAPIRRGDPGYRSALDRDGDGEGCAGD